MNKYIMSAIKDMPNVMKLIYFGLRCGLWHLNRLFRKPIIIKTKQGVFKLPMDVEDPISKNIYIKKEYEIDLIHDAMHLIRKEKGLQKGKGTLVDIGANNGVISIGMIVTGEIDRAVAIEPAPNNFANLKKNVQINNLESVIKCLNYAVSDMESTLQFELSENNYGDHRVRKTQPELKNKELYVESERKIINVEANTLENLLAGLEENIFRDISVGWIDVQGFEGYVFAGAKELLSGGIPFVAEIWPYGIQRTGMSQEDFCNIVGDIWANYWIRRKGKFVKYPIGVFHTIFEELGYDGDFDSVIFTS